MKLYDAILLAAPINMINILLAVIPAYLLWNWIVPDVFSLPHIGFLQTLGLILLVKCITGSGLIQVNS